MFTWPTFLRDDGVNVPVVRGSRPTPRRRSDSTCLARGSETLRRCHTARRRRPLLGRAVPLYSEGRWGRARRGSSSRRFPSACCRCNPEDSSARGPRSKRPEEETQTSDMMWDLCGQQLRRNIFKYEMFHWLLFNRKVTGHRVIFLTLIDSIQQIHDSSFCCALFILFGTFSELLLQCATCV